MQRHLVSGAQILNMTLPQWWPSTRRSAALRTPTTRSPLTQPTVRAGMTWESGPWPRSPPDTATGEQTIIEYPNPAPPVMTPSPVVKPAENFPPRSPAPMGIGQ